MAKKSSSRSAGNKGKRANNLSFSRYIHRVLKQIHADVSISKNAMKIFSSFINDTFEKIAAESLHLAATCKHKTLTSRTVQSAVKLVIPGELKPLAVSEGVKAVFKHQAFKKS